MASHFSNDNSRAGGNAPAGHGQVTGSRFSRNPNGYASGANNAGGYTQDGYGYNGAGANGYAQGGYGPNGYAPSNFEFEDPGMSRGKKIAIAVAVVFAVLLVITGACGFALYRSVKTVKSNASTAMSQVSVIKSSLKSGDAAGLRSSVNTVVNNTNVIYNEVTSPVWNVASVLPVVGQDIKSTQTLVSTVKNLVDNVLEPISDDVAGTSLSSLVSGGSINAELVAKLCDDGLEALPTIEESVQTINSLPDARISKVQEIFNKVKQPLSGSSDTISQLRPILENLPRMIGAEGTRNYLVIAQNNAEFRPTGGLPGSWGTVTVDNGTISMGEFTSILHQEGLSVAMTEEEQAAIGIDMGSDPAQVNCTADFLRVGEMSKEYWAQATGQQVDGVIAIDPVFLQSLVGLTGGFAASDGTEVTGDNCAELLMSTSYEMYKNDNDAQDSFFSSVASSAFNSVLGNLGSVDSGDLVDVVKHAAWDHRLMVWMANEDEESLIKSFNLDGGLQTDVTEPELGVYVSDDTWSKIDWYVKLATTMSDPVRNADGTTSYTVQTDLTNTLSTEQAEELSEWVTGFNGEKRSKDDIRSYLYIYSPLQGTISDIQLSGDGLVDGEDPEIPVNTLEGCQVARFHVHTGAGATTTVTYTITVPAEATETMKVRMTPLANEALAQ